MLNCRPHPHLSTPPPPPPTMPTSSRAPTWFSTRRIFEQNLEDLHKCTDLRIVKQIFSQVIRRNLQSDLYVAPKLISAFSSCRQIASAVKVFNLIPNPNIHVYNALIRENVRNSRGMDAFSAFIEMISDGIFPDCYTYTFLLKGNLRISMVKMIHTHIVKGAFLSDIYVPNSLIGSYSKCGAVGVKEARNLFRVMEERDTVSWNSMISGLMNVGEVRDARQLFDEMPERDLISWNGMLDGYVKAGQVDKAFELFETMPDRNVVSWTTMVLGYSKAGDMDMARFMFELMPDKNLITWTVIISGYAEKGMAKEAISLFDEMERNGVKLDDRTSVIILSACAESGLLGLGSKVHNSIEKAVFRRSILVSNALFDMYSKCGNVDEAWSIFNTMPKRDMVSWNAMLQALGMHGHGVRALQLFSRMKREGFKPDKVTFIGVLCACTHAGLVDEGIRFFHTMESDYGVVPGVKHYGCMIDLLGRAGRLEEAFRLAYSMPFEQNAIIWGTLLSAFRMHNAADLAEKVLHQLGQLEPSDSGNYSMLSNIFAASGDWNNVANVRHQMKSKGVQKSAGASSIELENEVHEFTVSDKSHPKSVTIYQMLHKLNRDLKQFSRPKDKSMEVGELFDVNV